MPSQMPNFAPAHRIHLPSVFPNQRRPCMSLKARRKPVAVPDVDEDNEEGGYFASLYLQHSPDK